MAEDVWEVGGWLVSFGLGILPVITWPSIHTPTTPCPTQTGLMLPKWTFSNSNTFLFPIQHHHYHPWSLSSSHHQQFLQWIEISCGTTHPVSFGSSTSDQNLMFNWANKNLIDCGEGTRGTSKSQTFSQSWLFPQSWRLGGFIDKKKYFVTRHLPLPLCVR